MLALFSIGGDILRQIYYEEYKVKTYTDPNLNY